MRKKTAESETTMPVPSAPLARPGAEEPLPPLSAVRRRLRTYRSILDEAEAFAPSQDDPYPDNHGPREPRRSV